MVLTFPKSPIAVFVFWLLVLVVLVVIRSVGMSVTLQSFVSEANRCVQFIDVFILLKWRSTSRSCPPHHAVVMFILIVLVAFQTRFLTWELCSFVVV